MKCEEALEKLCEYIDREAIEVDCQMIQEHLKDCKDCTSRYEFAELCKSFLTQKGCSEVKTHKLRKRILTCIDEAENSFGGLKRRFLYWPVAISAVLALVICIVSAFAVARFYRHKIYTYPFEKRHLQTETELADIEPSVDELVAVRSFVADDSHLALNADPPGFMLVQAGFDRVSGNDFAILRYTAGNDHVSLFIGNADGVRLPDFEKAVSAGYEYFKHVCRECQVIYWTCDNTIIIVVTENKSLDLVPFLPFDQST